jgi:ABC-type polysaccharide/polyol phosphate transport system ATPase subunit
VTTAANRVIQLDGVGKRYTKYDDVPMLATSFLNVLRRGQRSLLWAVRNLDLSVNAGDCFGVIGRNGSGKSTLLQMMSGITAPTEGRVRVRGRVAPLISVGVGFHPELSGRDNLHVNGAILGLTRAEVNRRFDEVVEFAEMEKFVDTPVKFYSSGMIVRLGFSMAIHSTPDVLIVDEVLAVGDIAFQVKCFDRMKAIREQGTTIIVVSHNLSAIRGLCDRALVLHEGQRYYEGDTAEAVSKLHELLQARPDIGPAIAEDRMPFEADVVEVDRVEIVGSNGRRTHHVKSGEDVRVRLHVRALKDVAKPFVFLGVVTETGVTIIGDLNRTTPFRALRAGQETVYEVVWPAKLATGTYLLRTMVGRSTGRQGGVRLAMPPPVSFYIAGKWARSGLVDIGATFSET